MEIIKIFAMVAVFIAVVETQDIQDAVNEDNLHQICNRVLPLTRPLVAYYCCVRQAERFREGWYYGGFYLSRYLELLKIWSCYQLDEECTSRRYEYNEFTKLTYDKFCNRTALEEKCTPILQEAVSNSKSVQTIVHTNSSDTLAPGEGDATGNSSWDQLVRRIDTSALEFKDIVKPCVQVAQMDSPTGGFGDFHEIVSPNIPFCSLRWCGFSRSVVESEAGIRPYDCMPSLCQANIIIMMTVIILLAIAIVIANVIIIIVFTTTPKLNNSQAMFKISLAIADLLVGVFVLPTFVVNLSWMALERAKMGKPYVFTDAELNFSHPFIDWDQAPKYGRDGFSVLTSTGFFSKTFSEGYKYAAGCVTSVSVLVSIYTLSLAGFDRLFAVYMPLRYRKHDAPKIAVRLSIALWIFAIILSLIPLMSNQITYALVSSMLFALYGPNAHIFYIVVIIVPLVIVWITSISIYATVRKQTAKRKEIASRQQSSDTENRLAVTLAIMAGVFTLSVIPTTVISAVSLTVKYKLVPEKPEEFDPHRDAIMNSADFVAAVIMMCNSLWNCFIYSTRNNDFRKASVELCHRIRRAFRLAKERQQSRKSRKTRTSRGFGRFTVTTSMSATVKSGVSSRSKTSPSTKSKSTNADAESPKRGTSLFGTFAVGVSVNNFFRSITRREQHPNGASNNNESGDELDGSRSSDFAIGQENQGQKISPDADV